MLQYEPENLEVNKVCFAKYPHGSAILNLITCTNFTIRYSILEAHLGLP